MPEVSLQLGKVVFKFSLGFVIRISLLKGTSWVLGFELGNWVSLRGLKQEEIVSIRKNVWELSVVMATDIL